MNSHRDGETGPPLSPENTRVLEDIKLITRILSDPVIDQEYHRIRTEILRKRRIHRGRLALAGRPVSACWNCGLWVSGGEDEEAS